MNNLKFGVLVCGVAGLIGCFLPMISAEGMSVSLWDAHSAAMGQVLMVMIGFALPIAMGAMAAKGAMQRWQAIVALVGFAFVVFKFRDGFMDMLTHGAIGAKLMWLGAVVGAVLSVLCIAKPEQAK